MQASPDTQADDKDEVLVEKCKRGNDYAFQQLMHRYLEPIFNFVRQYTKNREDAEDIAQDTFFKAWKHIKRFTEGRSFRPWLYTIARNTALDHVKKKHASSFSALDDEEGELSYAESVVDTEPLPQEIFERAQSATELTLLMDDLHPDHRAVLLLHYHQEMTFEEIAGTLQKPMNTVKSWHRRALLRLRDKIMHQRDERARTGIQ